MRELSQRGRGHAASASRRTSVAPLEVLAEIFAYAPSTLASAAGQHSVSGYGVGAVITVPAVEPIGTATVDVVAAIVFLKMYALVAASTGSCAVPMINLR